MYAYYIVVLFIKIEIYKLNQELQAVGYVFSLKIRRRVRIFSTSAVESAYWEKLRRRVEGR